jgi:hypothetical protein
MGRFRRLVYGALLSEIQQVVKWYNLRRYVSRTFIPKISNLSYLWDTSQ